MNATRSSQPPGHQGDPPAAGAPAGAFVRVAVAITRGWTALYTWRLPTVLREARRREIDSDIWEFLQDTHEAGRTPASAALHILARLLLGVTDDVAWRLELDAERDSRAVATRRMLWWITTASIGAVVIASWLATTLWGTKLPTPPRAPVLHARRLPPPPPPPPPPPRPRGL